jgi:hypothetical protein
MMHVSLQYFAHQTSKISQHPHDTENVKPTAYESKVKNTLGKVFSWEGTCQLYIIKCQQRKTRVRKLTY